MRLSAESIDVIVGTFLGNTGLTNCINKSEIDMLLSYGEIKSQTFDNFFEKYPELLSHPNFKSKYFKLEQYLKLNLMKINRTHKIYDVIKEYFSQLYNYTSAEDEVIQAVNDKLSKDNYQIVKIEETNEYEIYSLDDSMVNYDCLFKESKLGNYILINQQSEKCIKKIEQGDYMGAITNASSLLEQVLQEIIDHNGFNKTIKYDSKLKLFIDDVIKAMKFSDYENKFKKNIYEKLRNGFSNLTDGLYAMRNTMSDAHRVRKGYEPTQKDALLAVNTSKTIANFIVAEYFEKFVENADD